MAETQGHASTGGKRAPSSVKPLARLAVPRAPAFVWSRTTGGHDPLAAWGERPDVAAAPVAPPRRTLVGGPTGRYLGPPRKAPVVCRAVLPHLHRPCAPV